MQPKLRVLITFLIAVSLVAGLYFFTNWFSLITGYFVGESEQQQIAHCLSAQGTEFYGTEFCADCETQQKEFGKAFSLISYFDCGRDKENCPNIQSIPAWYIPNSDEKIYYGFKSLSELKELGKCQ